MQPPSYLNEVLSFSYILRNGCLSPRCVEPLNSCWANLYSELYSNCFNDSALIRRKQTTLVISNASDNVITLQVCAELEFYSFRLGMPGHSDISLTFHGSPTFPDLTSLATATVSVARVGSTTLFFLLDNQRDPRA